MVSMKASLQPLRTQKTTMTTSVASVRLLECLSPCFAFASVIEEVNNLQCALIVSQERGVHSYHSVYIYTDRLKWPVYSQTVGANCQRHIVSRVCEISTIPIKSTILKQLHVI